MSGCCCGSDKVTLVYACSGAANTGLLADRVARIITKDICGKMTCLAALEAELPGFIESARSATKNVVIDGCPVACGKKIFEKLGLEFSHYMTTDFGIEKGKTEITEKVVSEVKDRIKEKIING
jgi:uncharacterized metal-binding protein